MIEPTKGEHTPAPDDGRALPWRPSQKGRELLANKLVEKGRLGLMAIALDGDKKSTETMRWMCSSIRQQPDPQ